MSYETKWDVFDDALRALEEFGEQGSSWEMAYDDLSARYSAASDDALPDDMPVIPLTVGEYIEEVKAHGKFSIIDPLWRVGDALSTMGESGLGDRSRWVLHHSDDFARAWVLGVWRVEETGEIVKLEV